MALITVQGQRCPKGRALDSKEEAKMDSKRLLCVEETMLCLKKLINLVEAKP